MIGRSLVLPVPADAPPMPAPHFTLRTPSGRWCYRDAQGSVLFWVMRFETPDGKVYTPLTLWRDVQALQWQWKLAPTPHHSRGRR